MCNLLFVLESGYEACSKTGAMIVKQPIEYDAVTNRHDAAKIFHQTISNELRLDPTEHPAHLREAELNPKTNPEKMIFLMFDAFNAFNAPSFEVVIQGVLSQWSSWRITGVVFYADDGVSDAFPNCTVDSLRDMMMWLNHAESIIERRW
jgi:actin-related protein